MNPNWINDLRKEFYDKERDNIAKLIKDNIKQGADAIIHALEENRIKLKTQEQELNAQLSTVQDLATKLTNHYKLTAIKNLQFENEQMRAAITFQKDNLTSDATKNELAAEKKYFTDRANHLDRNMHDLHDVYVKKSQIDALMAINPPNKALQRLNEDELHEVYLSMPEITHIPIRKEYEDISATMKQHSQREYQFYTKLNTICQNAISASDEAKELAMKKNASQKTDVSSEKSKAAIFSNKSSFFQNGPKIHATKEQLLLENAVIELQAKKVQVHKELAEIKGQMSEGNFDKNKLSKLQFESDLINQSLRKIAKTEEIIKSPKLSAEVMKEKVQQHAEVKSAMHLKP